MPRYIVHEKDGEEIFRGIWNGEITSDMPEGFANITMRIVYEQDEEEPASAPDLLEQERNARPDLFSNTDSPQTVSDPMGEALDRQREANKQLCAPALPDEIANLLEPGETLTKDVRRKLTERLNVELAELKNLRGLAGEDRKREAEIEKLLGLFARLGEI